MRGTRVLPLAVLAGVALSGGIAQAAGLHAIPVRGCTIAAPPTAATVEARIAHADDFCELLSKALAGDVYHSAVIVTPGTLWHYSRAPVSCRLQFKQTADVTIRNSPAACRWFVRRATGWKLDARPPKRTEATLRR